MRCVSFPYQIGLSDKQWTPQAQHAPTDGFEIMRRGDVNVKCRIILDVAHFPERFKIINPLADLIAMKEGTRSEIMAAVWKLIKLSGAQDKEDSTVVRPVGGMQKVRPSNFGRDVG